VLRWWGRQVGGPISHSRTGRWPRVGDAWESAVGQPFVAVTSQPCGDELVDAELLGQRSQVRRRQLPGMYGG